MACARRSAGSRSDRRTRRLTVAVNLSARQFEPGDLPAVVRATLEQTGLDPTCLHLELTETAIIDLRPDILQQLGQIRDLGVQIGLDDFGTGYASLTHLRRLPADASSRSTSPSCRASAPTRRTSASSPPSSISPPTSACARSPKASRRPTSSTALRELGCDQAQGYLFARPLPPDDVATAIRTLVVVTDLAGSRGSANRPT